MPVRPRSDRPGRWLVDFRVAGRRFRTTVEAPGRRAAEAMEHELRIEAREALAAEARRLGDGPALGELCARYWQEHARHLSWSSHVRSHLDRWCDTLGDDRPARSITSADIARITGDWREELAPASINRRIAVIRAIWYLARDVWGIALAPIAWRRLTLKEPEPEDRSMTRDERRRFLAALPGRTRWPMHLIAATGLRRSAVLRLTRADLDWHRGVIRTISKGGRATPVPITQAVLALLTAMGRLPDCGLLFTVTPSQWRRDVARARATTGLAAAGAHPLRHSFAQDLEDAGFGDLVTTALHHSTPALRRRYAKARLDRTAAILDQVQR